MLRPSQSCSNTPFWGQRKSLNGSPVSSGKETLAPRWGLRFCPSFQSRSNPNSVQPDSTPALGARRPGLNALLFLTPFSQIQQLGESALRSKLIPTVLNLGGSDTVLTQGMKYQGSSVFESNAVPGLSAGGMLPLSRQKDQCLQSVVRRICRLSSTHSKSQVE